MMTSNSTRLKPLLIRRSDAFLSTGADAAGPPPTVASRLIVATICAMLTLATLAYGGVHYWALALMSVGAALIVIFWWLDAWQTLGLRFRASFLPLPLMAIALFGVFQLLPLRSLSVDGDTVSTSLSFDAYATRLAIVLCVILFIYFAAALAFIDRPSRVRGVTAFIIIFGVAIAVLGLSQYFLSPLKIYGLREPYQALPFGPFINRNHFAAFLTMVVPLPAALLLEGAVRGERVALCVFAIVLMVIAVVMTGSRGGLLALVLVTHFLLVVRSLTGSRTAPSEGHTSPRWRRRLAVVAVSIGSVALIGVLVLGLGGAAPLKRIFGQSDAEDLSAGGRLQYWRSTVAMIRDHPIVGVGLDGFSNAFPKYDSLNGTYRVERAHNDYLQTIAETGVVGSILALSFILVLFRQGFAAARSARDPWRRAVALGPLAGCFGVLVHSFFEFPLRTPANALLFLLLVGLATIGGEVFARPAAPARPV